MGLLRRTRGRDDRPLSELTDEELEAELIRRRRERATRHEPTSPLESPAKEPEHRQLAQCYANLELKPGASLEEVRVAYRELMRKYHPDQYLGDPEKHRVATELAHSLTEAYRRLSAHMGEK